jgi:hypothetical protein
MKKTFKFFITNLIFTAILLVFVIPSISFAVEPEFTGLVPCNNTTIPCDFNALMAMVNGIINFILKNMVIPIAAIMFAYAGFLMVTAGDEVASARTKAKNIFTNAVIGLALAVGGWLIISTILAILGYDGTWIGLYVSL